MALTDAHKGYEYQDIYSAYLILKAFREFKDFEFFVDHKEHNHDSFDDLVIVTPQRKIKFQIRHSSGLVLSKNELTKSGRYSLKDFSKSFAASKIPTQYVLATTGKIDLRDTVFKKVTSNSSLLSKHLWSVKKQAFPAIDQNFLSNFFIETRLPSISNDFRNPGSLEILIFEYLKQEIGVGGYPNDQLFSEAFADAICRLIRSMRSGSVTQPLSKVALINLLQTSGLKTDYGHIAQQFPLIADKQRLHFKNLQDKLKKDCLDSSNVILVGLPGSGKSHQFDALFRALNQDKHVIAVQHYCYLEPTDDLVVERINVNRMFGNIVHQLTTKFPDIGEKLPRLYTADRIKIEEFAKAITTTKNKRVVVMIDGLDHLERVVNQNGSLSTAVVNKFIDELLKLRLPKNSTLLISSQPGLHLRKFKQRKDVKVIEIPSWTERDTERYLLKEGISKELLLKQKDSKTFLGHIVAISEGNPLYLNYLTKEIKSRILKGNDALAITDDLPKLDSNINRYYDHLIHTIRNHDLSIAETVALLDFSITKNQLGEIFPAIDKQRVLSVLNQLNSVLIDSFSIGGFRIYHESFRRYVLENALKRRTSKKNLYSHIIRWLTGQNFFSSVLSYNYLFSYLKRGQQEKLISAFVGQDFLTESLYNFHSISTISQNIAIAADVAASSCDWATLARLTQINKALYTFSEERDYIFDDLAEAYLKVFGPESFSNRMVLNGKRIFPLTLGFKYCHRISKVGGIAPWAAYDLSDFKITVDSEVKKSLFFDLEAGSLYRVIFGKDVSAALGHLFYRIGMNRNLTNQKRVDMLVEQVFLQNKHEIVFDTFLKSKWAKQSDTKTLLAFAIQAKSSVAIKGISALLAGKRRSLNINEIKRLAKSRIDISPFLNVVGTIKDFKKSSVQINALKSLYENDLPNFQSWYSHLGVVATFSGDTLREIRTSINPDGWYRGWLIFLIDLSLAETVLSQNLKEAAVLKALQDLSQYQAPFRGEPRACDLYSIHHLTGDSFRRAIEAIHSTEVTKKIIPLLEKISAGSTTTLQRSPGGPLTEEALSEIYAECLPTKSRGVRDLLKRGILAQFKLVKDRGRYYETQATEGFKAACVLVEVREIANAHKVFKDACRYAYGYGMRKDITLWDIIAPIPSLHKLDKRFAIKAFEKTYLLPHIVGIHTDGAETKWALSRWYESLFDADIALGIRFLHDDIDTNHVERDWRIEFISEDLANRLVGKIDPVLVANLYRTLEMGDYDRTDFNPRLKLLEEFFCKKLPTDDYIYDLSLSLTAWRYSMTDKSPYVAILEKFFALQHKYDFKVAPYLAEFLKQKIADANKPSSFPELKTQKTVEMKKQEKLFWPTMTNDQIRLVLDECLSDNLSQPENINSFTKLVIQITKQGYEDEASALIVQYARRSHVYGPLRALESIGDKLNIKGYKNLAAEAYVVGFFYSHGRSGWLILGDEASYPMAKKAILISKKIFHTVLAREIAQSIEKPVYFTGGNQHLIELFCNVAREVVPAKKIWTESFSIINNRLSSTEIPGLKMPSTLSRARGPFVIESEINKLIKARNKIT